MLAIIALFQALTSGLFNALLTLSQLLAVFLCADLVTGTTSTLSMIDAFLRFFRPLERIGIPLQTVSLAMMLALRFVPAQLSDWGRRYEAWCARGGDKGSWIMIPIWVSDFMKNSDRVAEALDTRGFNASKPFDHAKS